MHPGDFGGQRAINMEHLASYSFLSDEARRIWNLKLEEPNFPIDLFSVKLLLSNASRLKSSKESPTAATLREE